MIIRILLPRLMQSRLRDDILIVGFPRVGGFRVRGFDVACAAALRHNTILACLIIGEVDEEEEGEKAMRVFVCDRGIEGRKRKRERARDLRRKVGGGIHQLSRRHHLGRQWSLRARCSRRCSCERELAKGVFGRGG